MSYGQAPSSISATRLGDEIQPNLQEQLLQTDADSFPNPPPTNPSYKDWNLGMGITTDDRRHLHDGKTPEIKTEGYGTTWNGRAPSRVALAEKRGKAAAKQEGKTVAVSSKRGEVMTYYDARSHKYAESEARKREWEETAHIRQVEDELRVRAWEGGDDFQLMHQEPHTQPKDPYKMPEPVVDPYASASKTDGTYMSEYDGNEYKPASYDVSEYTSVYDRKHA